LKPRDQSRVRKIVLIQSGGDAAPRKKVLSISGRGGKKNNCTQALGDRLPLERGDYDWEKKNVYDGKPEVFDVL